MEKPQIRKTPRTVWLNNQLAIPPSHEVIENYSIYADPFSLVPTSAVKFLKEAEESIRKSIGAKLPEIFHFVPHYPHIVKIIVAALLENQNFFQGRNHLILPSHDQQIFIDALCRRHGLGATYDWVTTTSEGRISEEQLVEALTPRTLLFSMSAAHGLTGVIQPLEKILKICKERKVLLHVDISDILGRASLPSEIFESDIITFSSMALGGIGHIGGMFLQKSLENIFSPWFPSSPSGVLNLASVAAMQTACKERASALPLFSLNTINLRNKLITNLQKTCPSIQILFSQIKNLLPNILVVALPDIPAESLTFFLHQQGIYPGLGYERFQPLSQVLQNCGVTPFLCHGALHFSLTERNKGEQFDILTKAIHDGIQFLNPLIAHSI
ncbi:aminotransferase class V-fold PLP-dependent enzyme [Chlamydia sp. 17-3921]|uniref:aminotransferase class V-fold PLP-dependent enzyme n=1 Tax=Chlamydia sp. 17-3921 TaxID=2675798 RepID=UPI00191B2738|nr:aminotransferase class V-fold PLP-dependent enzyme [Chlamydia sp. 17-3921]